MIKLKMRQVVLLLIGSILPLTLANQPTLFALNDNLDIVIAPELFSLKSKERPWVESASFCAPVHSSYGSRVQYQAPFSVDQNVKLQTSCEKWWDSQNLESFKHLVDGGYGFMLSLDKLPAALKWGQTLLYNEPIPLGYKNSADHQYFVYNHLHLTVQV